MSVVEFGDLTMPQVAALPAGTVAVLPLGAIEQHGPHLPVATDLLIAQAAARAALERVDGAVSTVLLPALAYTKSDEHAWAPGTLWVSASTLMATLTDLGRSLAACGLTRLLLVNAHGGNSALAQVACRQVRRETGMRTFLAHVVAPQDHSSPGRAGVDASTADERGAGVHGGHVETSIVLHLRPDLVDMALATRRVPQGLDGFELVGFGRPVSFGWTSDDFGPDGHIGDPTTATAAHGAALFAAATDHLARAVAEVARFDVGRPAQEEA